MDTDTEGGLPDRLRAAGCRIAHYHADLYVPGGETSERILAEYESRHGKVAKERFVDRLTGKAWICVPGAYVPEPDPPPGPR